MFYRVLPCLLLLFITLNSTAQEAIAIKDNKAVALNDRLLYYIDPSGNSTADSSLIQKDFQPSSGQIVYPATVNNLWLKFKVKNAFNSPVFFDLRYTNLSQVLIYKMQENRLELLGKAGNDIPFHPVLTESPNIIFNLQLLPNQEAIYFVNVKSVHPVILPMYIVSQNALISSVGIQTMIVGIYLGLLGVMFLYNLFLYISTKDKNYLFYVIYIFFLALAQITAAGYGFSFLWPNNPFINNYSVIFTTSLSTAAATVFTMFFLQTALYTPRIHKLLIAYVCIYAIGIISNFLSNYNLSYSILNYNLLASGLTVVIASTVIARRGFRSAYFYLLAWSALLVSLFILVMRNLNVIPYNTFTAYIIYIGSGIEVALLSVALADKINILSKEKAFSQAQALEVLQENEKLIKGQNIMLEKRVAERTEELESTNLQLNHTLTDLKETQAQLVDAEKMASLGQLTAGIAHEINNPINFVKSNINPLRLDVQDLIEVLDEYQKLHTISDSKEADLLLKSIEKQIKSVDLPYVKTEIKDLLKGIEDGAERTAEIVRGLRTFSRLDESEVKTVDVHEGIQSTIVILRNSIPFYVSINTNFKAKGKVECFPGKLNQVFMNIINNAAQAIIAKKGNQENEFIEISTRDIENDRIEIVIKDSGTGMSEEVKHKIFEPFFTTKDVGEGTGLGMAIVFRIIKMHQGTINIISELEKGAEFIITLPYNHPDLIKEK